MIANQNASENIYIENVCLYYYPLRNLIDMSHVLAVLPYLY